MFSNEQRCCKRVEMSSPVKIGMVNDRGQHGVILDASVSGIRARMPLSNFHVGQEVDIAFLPYKGKTIEEPPFHCRVIWQNVEKLEVGLKYLQ